MNVKLSQEEEEFNKAKAYTKEMLKRFVFLTKPQLVALNNNNQDITERIMKKLVKDNDAAVFRRDENKQIIEYVADKSIDKKTNTRIGYQKAFNVYLALSKVMDIGAFCVAHDACDDCIVLSFEANRDIYDIVRISPGDEFIKPQLLHMKERYLPAKERERFHRIVMVDDERQLDTGISNIEGLEKVVAVDIEGNIKDLPVYSTEEDGAITWYRK